MPQHDALDVNHMFRYFERRALLIAFGALVLWQGLVALVVRLFWPQAPLGYLLSVSAICLYWPMAWRGYLRHHYKREFRTQSCAADATD